MRNKAKLWEVKASFENSSIYSKGYFEKIKVVNAPNVKEALRIGMENKGDFRLQNIISVILLAEED